MTDRSPGNLASVAWAGGAIEIVDQTRLPGELVILRLETVGAVEEAIRRLRVRGAPAIGACGALAVALALANGELSAGGPPAEFAAALDPITDRLLSARPTAVNLEWAVRGVGRRVTGAEAGERQAVALSAALAIIEADRSSCRAMAMHGAGELEGKHRVLTHCNTGSLATCGDGTALGVIVELWQRGGLEEALVCESRPLLQGARLTAWELARAGVPARVLADGAAAWALRQEMADAVVVGADRIARNGDVANKIGTYAIALASAAHRVPFYVVAPTSTFDLALNDGSSIPIEERDPAEVLYLGASRVAAEEAAAWNPAFDVTPAGLVTAIVTEHGVARPPYTASLAALAAAELASEVGSA